MREYKWRRYLKWYKWKRTCAHWGTILTCAWIKLQKKGGVTVGIKKVFRKYFEKGSLLNSRCKRYQWPNLHGAVQNPTCLTAGREYSHTCVWIVKAHAQKPDFVFRRNGRVHWNRRGRQFSRLLVADVCVSAILMLDTPCSEVVRRMLDTHSIRQFPLHFPSRASPCAITFQLDSTAGIRNRRSVHPRLLYTFTAWGKFIFTLLMYRPNSSCEPNSCSATQGTSSSMQLTCSFPCSQQLAKVLWSELHEPSAHCLNRLLYFYIWVSQVVLFLRLFISKHRTLFPRIQFLLHFPLISSS